MTDKEPSEYQKEFDAFYKGMQGSLGSLLYLPIGSQLVTSYGSFQKISDDLICLKSDVKPSDVTEGFEKNGIIRIVG